MSIKFEAGSLRVTIMNINRLVVSEKKAAHEAVAAAGKALEGKIRQNMSLRDHTDDSLRALDHPYARRHGSIRIHRKGSRSLVHPEFRVHTRTGALLGALRSRRGTGKKPNWRIWLDKGAAPHAVYVIQGTRVMLGRDVLWDTAIAPLTRRTMMKAIVKKLGQGLRSGAAVRFGSGARPGGALET